MNETKSLALVTARSYALVFGFLPAMISSLLLIVCLAAYKEQIATKQELFEYGSFFGFLWVLDMFTILYVSEKRPRAARPNIWGCVHSGIWFFFGVEAFRREFEREGTGAWIVVTLCAVLIFTSLFRFAFHSLLISPHRRAMFREAYKLCDEQTSTP